MNHITNISSFDESLIIRHFDKEITPEEKAVLLSWIEASGEHLETYLKMKQLWALLKVNHFASDIELKLAREKVEEKIQANRQARRRTVMRQIGKYAAMIVFLLGGYFLYRIINAEKPEQWLIIATTDNEAVRTVYLPDSTRVWLNKNTTLSYPETFAQRSVKIKGEAFFNVVADAERPFAVEANELLIRVTGTSFNVRNRLVDSLIQITLTEGKIELYDGYDTMLSPLLPGQQAVFHRNGNQLKIREVKTDLYTSWRTGLVMFEKAYLTDILAGIEEAYDVRIIYNSNRPLLNQYNFVFRNSQPIETVLEMLKFVVPITYKKNNNDIYINQISK